MSVGGPRYRLLQVLVLWKIIMWTLWVMELVMFLLFHPWLPECSELGLWSALPSIQYLSGLCSVCQSYLMASSNFSCPRFSSTLISLLKKKIVWSCKVWWIFFLNKMNTKQTQLLVNKNYVFTDNNFKIFCLLWALCRSTVEVYTECQNKCLIMIQLWIPLNAVHHFVGIINFFVLSGGCIRLSLIL